MKKNIQVMLKASISVLEMWRRVFVFGILLLALVSLEYPEQFNYPEADIIWGLTRCFQLIVLIFCFCSSINFAFDTSDWWSVFGNSIGWLIGCVILEVFQESLYGLAVEGVIKGWLTFIGVSITLNVLQYILGWREQK